MPNFHDNIKNLSDGLIERNGITNYERYYNCEWPENNFKFKSKTYKRDTQKFKIK